MVLLLLLVPLVLTALMPRRWLGPWFATLLLGFALCWLDFSRVNARAGDMLGMGFLMLMLSALLAVGAVRWALTAIFRRTPVPVADRHAVHLYYAALGGPVVATVLLGAALQVVDAWWPDALALHLGAVVVGVGWWFAMPKVWPPVWPLSTVPYRMQARTVFRMAGLVAIVSAIAWSLASSSTKVDAAQQAAQGQPYCLLSASPHGMQPVVSRLDLSGFAARAGRRPACAHGDGYGGAACVALLVVPAICMATRSVAGCVDLSAAARPGTRIALVGGGRLHALLDGRRGLEHSLGACARPGRPSASPEPCVWPGAGRDRYLPPRSAPCAMDSARRCGGCLCVDAVPCRQWFLPPCVQAGGHCG